MFSSSDITPDCRPYAALDIHQEGPEPADPSKGTHSHCVGVLLPSAALSPIRASWCSPGSGQAGRTQQLAWPVQTNLPSVP